MLKTFPSSEDVQIQIKATPRIVDTGSRRLLVSLTVKYVYFRLIQQQYDKTLLYKKLCEDVGKTGSVSCPCNIEGVRFASKIIFLLSNVFALLRK